MKNRPSSPNISIRNRAAFEIALLYLTIGVLWILFSDKAVARFAPNQAVLTQISIYKGWGYVLVTALLLYWMIRLYTQRMIKAEWILSENEKKYQELLQQASDGILIADAKGQYTIVNEEACRLVGYTKDELLSLNLRELVAPEDLNKNPLRLDELQAGKTLITERILLRKDGSRIACEISAKMLTDGRYQSIIRDITERKVTEDALRRSEKRYRSLFENMTNGFARGQILYENEIPNDFIYLDINDAFKKLTGLQDVIGKRVSAVIPGIRESNPELFEIYGRVASTGKPEKFETYIPGLGSGIWFSVSVYSTEKDFFVAVFETITERKLAETVLRENEERLRLSLHAANQGLYDLNVQTGDAVVNREYAEMLGYNPDSFVETNAAWIERLHPDDREITTKAYTNYINGLTPEYRVEFRQRTNAGGWKWILSLGKVVEFDSAGKPLRMLGTHTDITERKQAEAALQKAHDELELQVQLRTQALSQTNTLLETMLEYMPDQIYFKDTESRFIRNSRTQALALGLSDPSQVIGKTDFDFFPHAQRSYDEEQEIIRSGKPLVDFEELVVWPNHMETWVSTTKAPLRDQTGQIIGTFGISRDITERKRNEAALLKAKEELELKVAERTTELRKINEQLRVELSERKRAEEALRDSEALFRQAIEAAGAVPYSHNYEADTYTFMGEGILTLTGYPVEEMTPSLYGSLEKQTQMLGEASHLLSTQAGKLMRAGHLKNWRCDSLVLARDGTPRWIADASVATFDGMGNAIGSIGILQDITERKRAEEALRASEEKFSILFEKSAIAIVLSTLPDGIIMNVNEAFERIFGFTKLEAHGKTTLELGINPDAEGRARSLAALKEYGFVRDLEIMLRVRSGELRLMSVNIDFINIGGQKYILNMIQDITERKHAEEELRQSRENFAKAFISNPAAIAITRLTDGKFINVNPAYARIMEYEPDEILNRTAAEMNIYVHPEERDQLIRQLREQGIIQNYELHVRTKSGETRSIVISMEPLLYNEEECILSVFIDISERQKMEAELQRSNAELEQFAYIASHDLQEPLRAVAGMVQLLQQRYQGKLDERADEYIGHAVEASTRMQKLINDLLDYSRVGRLGKPFESTDSERSLNAALANLQTAIHESNAQITHDPLPTLMADAGQLTQILQNLIANAIKFRGAGPLHIHIGAKKIERAWQFNVSDNGIGIEPQYFERIFLVFQRLHTRREYPGTGIGLSLCKKIIERHGGQIWVELQPRQGSTFYFTIPERQV